MKKFWSLLIIGHQAGEQVCKGGWFVKYLPNYNYKPIVYTVENGEYPVIDDSLNKDVSTQTKILKTKIWEPYSLYKIFTGRKKKKINSSF